MIFYFSASGNSGWVARSLSATLCEPLVSVADACRMGLFSYALKPGEKVGFVFPVYAWGMPRLVERFIDGLELEGSPHPYLYMVCTCGDDIGLTAGDFCRKVGAKGWECAACFSVRMPNTYVCLPGMDVDDADTRRRKLQAAVGRLQEVGRRIDEGRVGVREVTPGALPWMKSRVLRPLFNRFLVTDRPFRSTDACIGCGVCEQVCPVRNIRLDSSKRPTWKGECIGCLACYHHCPRRAIRFGGATERKGQYVFPRSGR